LEIRAKEEADREGYARQPQVAAEAQRWETEAVWGPE
jgi:hypothetical protein